MPDISDSTMPAWGSLVVFTESDAIGSYTKLIGKLGVYKGLRSFSYHPRLEINFENSRSVSVRPHQVSFISDPIEHQVGDMVYYSTSHPEYVGRPFQIVEIIQDDGYILYKVRIDGRTMTAYLPDLIPVQLPNKAKSLSLERGD